MAVPRLFAVGLWLAVTAGATAMVWGATSIVAADVTDRPAPVVAHRDVVSQLAAAPPAPTTTAPKPPPEPTTVPSKGLSQGTPRSGASVPATSPPSTAPPATTPSSTPPITVKTSPLGPTTTTTTPASPQSATYSTPGGVVAVSCNGFFITLVSAIPSNGFATEVLAQGPANVDVHFVRPGQDLAVQVVCFGRPIRYDGPMPTR